MSTAHNILVVSDLHLGEDLSPTATPADTRHVDMVDRHLVEFLRHYARRRLDGNPWRLIVNGDMIEFLGICLWVEDVPEAEAEDVPAEDRVYGLDRRPIVACAKMRAVLDRHREVFRAMARFLSVGNRMEIIVGNHDTELHWPQVQEVFRNGIARAWDEMPGSRRQGGPDSDEIVSRIRFHPWFFYEPGTAWVEHGHQYDESCSFEYGLNPVDPGSQHIVTNVDAAALRYVASHNHVQTHGAEDWSLLGYVRLAFGLGLRGSLRLFRSYTRFTSTLVNVWRGHASHSPANRERREVHEDRRAELARQWGIDEKTLRTIDEMRRPPVPTNLPRLLKLLMVDKLALSLLTALAVLLSLLVLPIGWALLASSFALVGGWAGSRMLSRGRHVSPTVPLLLMPARIVRKLDAPFVVFGHTHDPIAQQIEGDHWYFNTGTWVPTGKPGLLRAFTHLVIRHTDHGPTAELCQWRDGASRQFTPGWAPVATTAEEAEERDGAGEVQVA